MTDFAVARQNMVDSQVRPNRVRDRRLIDALLTIPRERFVPRAAREIAYLDEDLSLGNGRWLMEPMAFARMLEEASIGVTDRVLEVGSATGYGTAVLARMSKEVVAIESDASLARAARQTLSELGIANATVLDATLADGAPALAPYDVIVLTGAVPEVPIRLQEQLADNGRLVAVVRASGRSSAANLVTRTAGVLGRRILFDAAVKMLPGFAKEPTFMF